MVQTPLELMWFRTRLVQETTGHAHPLMPLDTALRTNQRWKTTKIVSVGSVAIAAKAITCPHWRGYWPKNDCIASGSVAKVSPRTAITGHSRSPQRERNCRTAT